VKREILKMTILYTLFSISTLSATCDNQAKTEAPLSKHLETEIQLLKNVTSTIRKSFSTEDIRTCIENSLKLERIIKDREGVKNTLEWYTKVLLEHKRRKEIIQERIDFFNSECDNDGENCLAVDFHKRKLYDEYQSELDTKLEIASYISEGIELKIKEESLRKSFDVNCQEQKYEKSMVIKTCRKFYAYDAPICRDYF